MLSSETEKNLASKRAKESDEKRKKAGKAKWWGIILKILGGAAIILLVVNILNYLVYPAKAYTRIQLHDLYTEYNASGKNIDLLFLGTSHAYRCFDTEVFDEMLGVESYNFGTSMQTISASYYLLKEVLKTNKPDRVVFELTYTCFNEKDHQPLKSVIVSQYMAPSLNKLDFILHEFEFEDIFYAILPAFCYRENLNRETIASTLSDKATRAFKEYDAAITKSETEWMENKGFVYTDRELAVWHVGQRNPEAFAEEEISPKYLEYFMKIIDLCRENGTELVFVTAPIPKASLLELGNYSEVCRYFDKIAADNGIRYYNFNLIRPEVLDLSSKEYYDSHHVNGKGGKMVSEVLADIFREEEQGSLIWDRYFYSDWDEVVETIDYITNVFMTVETEGDQYILTGHAYSGVPDAEYEYSYYLYEGPGKDTLLRDWSSDPVYVMPKYFKSQPWRIHIAGRFVGSEATLNESQRQIRSFPLETED